MNFWTFLFFAMILAIPLSAIWTSHLQKIRAPALRYGQELEALKGELERLRERTELIEEVVTDRRFELKERIDALD